ncbi:MAG: hypothetical protein ABJD38_19870 [Aurantimonas coralicida]
MLEGIQIRRFNRFPQKRLQSPERESCEPIRNLLAQDVAKLLQRGTKVTQALQGVQVRARASHRPDG